jgi:hypothetical protein
MEELNMKKARSVIVVVVGYEDEVARRYTVRFNRKLSRDYFQYVTEKAVALSEIIGKTDEQLSVLFPMFSPELIQCGILPSDFE